MSRTAFERNPLGRRRTYLVSDRITITVVESPEDRTGADLADVVRTLLGPLVRELDLPRIHVMAEGHRVLLHGDVATKRDARLVEKLVRTFPGVTEVESHLHIGLLPSDTRRSQTNPPESAMLREFYEEVDRVGISRDERDTAVRGTLGAVLDQIHEGEREHVWAHLPSDVRALLAHAGSRPSPTGRWSEPETLELDAAIRSGVSEQIAVDLTPRIIAILRGYVPEEDEDIRASLSHHLRAYWEAQAPVQRDEHRVDFRN